MPRRTRPSLTARNVAIVRRGLSRPTVPTGDAEGDDRLAASFHTMLPFQLPGLTQYLAARTTFFDDGLLRACTAGARQVVIVAAGYDGRSVRFRQPGVTFFELDHPATQADKRARLDEAGVDASDVRFVPLDIGHDDVGEVLAAAGFDRAAPTHVMCEGLTAYLPLAVLRRLLASLAAAVAPGATLAIDFAEPGHRRSLASRLSLTLTRLGTAAMGERIVTLLAPEEATSLLAETGWPDVELAPPDGFFPVVFAEASAPRPA